MVDIAQLGYSVDTGGLRAGEAALNRFSAANKRAAADVVSQNGAVAAAARRSGISYDEMASRVASAGQRMRDASRATNVVPFPQNLIPPNLIPQVEGGERAVGSLRSTLRLLAREANLVGGPMGGVVSQVGTLILGGTRLGLILTGTTIALAAVAAAVYKAVDAYSKLETQQAQAAAALSLTKGASGQTVLSLDALTKSMSASGTQTVESIRAAETELLKYKAVSGETFGAVLKVAKDVAATGFADLKTATEALGKALQDPRQATEALLDVGLKLTVAEQRLATQFVNTGKASEARRLIIDAASRQAAGGDTTAANTLSAAWGRLVTSSGSVLEVWGRQISEGLHLQGVIDGISAAADREVKRRAAATKYDPSAGTFSDQFMTMKEQQRSGATTPKIMAPGTSFNDRFDTAGIEKQSAKVVELNQNMKAQRDAIDKVNEGLRQQGETAGMSAVQQETFRAAQDASVQGDKAKTQALRDQINAIHGMNEIRAVTDQIKANTDAQKVEAATMEMNVGAALSFKTVQDALTQARIKDISYSAAQTAEIQRLANALGEAALATERMRVSTQINFDRKTAFFSPEDLQIAQSLKGLYGSDVPKAMASSEAAGMRLNNALKSSASIGGEFASGLVKDLAHGVDKATALRSALSRLGDTLIDIGSKAAVNALLSGILGTALGGLGGAKGLGSLRPFGVSHAGRGPGENSPTRWINVDEMPRAHSGIGPGERATIIKDDESVMTPGQMMAAFGGGSRTPTYNVQVHDYSGHAQVNQSRDPGGGIEVIIPTIEDMMATRAAHGRGSLGKTMSSRQSGRNLRG